MGLLCDFSVLFYRLTHQIDLREIVMNEKMCFPWRHVLVKIYTDFFGFTVNCFHVFKKMGFKFVLPIPCLRLIYFLTTFLH